MWSLPNLRWRLTAGTTGLSLTENRPPNECLPRAAGWSADLHPPPAAHHRLTSRLPGNLRRPAAARAAREPKEQKGINKGPTPECIRGCNVVASMLQACCKPVAGLFEAFIPPPPHGFLAVHWYTPAAERQTVPKRPSLRYRPPRGWQGYKDATVTSSPWLAQPPRRRRSTTSRTTDSSVAFQLNSGGRNVPPM